MNDSTIRRATKFLNSWLQLRYDRLDLPGFVVAVSHKGKLIFHEAYGYADIEQDRKMRKNDVFHVASHSKTFTSTALLQLQEQGKIRIDDRLSDHLDWLKSHPDEQFQKLTIRQVLSHSAGITRDGQDSGFWQLERPFPSEAIFKEEILSASTIISNNTRMKYSNYGFGLLGMLIEKVSGMPYNDYVAKNIIDAIGLKNTSPDFDVSKIEAYATGYTRRDFSKKRLPIDHVPTNALSAATGFCSTAEDLCKYFTAQIVGSGELLDDESKKEMQRTQWRVSNAYDNEEYGLGTAIEFASNKRTFGHGGGFPGFITKTLCYPEDELVVVALTNASDGAAGFIAKGVFSVLDFFISNSGKPTYENLEGTFMSLDAIATFVAKDKGMLCLYPDVWFPFSATETLVHERENTFSLSDTNSFGNEGEKISFMRSTKGDVESVMYSGTVLLPAKRWLEINGVKKKISLK